MLYKFEQLTTKLREFREIADGMFSLKDAPPASVSMHFLALAIATTSLYLEYLLFSAALPKLYEESEDGAEFDVSGSVAREMQYRDLYGHALNALPWGAFHAPVLAMEELKTFDDYKNGLYLHIPEIYEECLSMQQLIAAFEGASPSSQTLTDLEIGMSHLGNNHATFVIPVLQGLGNENNWAYEPTSQ